VRLEEDGQSTPWVGVRGLSDADLAALRTAVWREEGWQGLMTVSVSGGDGTPLPGRYVTSREMLEFHPRLPLEIGQSYRVRFDPSRLPAPRAGPVVEATLELPPRPVAPPPAVTSISPSGDVLPANVLRLYVEFPVPMARSDGGQFVRLLDDAGHVVEGALAPSAIDFWNRERTRYTVFLDQKGSIAEPGPGRTSSRVLVPGRTYTLVVDPGWRDAQGRQMTEGHRHTFRVGPAIEAPLLLADWKVAAPRARSTAAVVVTFPQALDIGLLHRSLAVARSGEPPLRGTVAIGRGETEWRFTPESPWRRGLYELLVLSTLEDPAGNRLGRSSIAATPPEDEPPPPEQLSVPFEVR
jgi:hypothetical protein